jgi:hypothetical protein
MARRRKGSILLIVGHAVFYHLVYAAANAIAGQSEQRWQWQTRHYGL